MLSMRTNKRAPDTFPQAAVTALTELESLHAHALNLHLEYSKLQHRFPKHRRALIQRTPRATYQPICEQRIATLTPNGRSYLNCLTTSDWLDAMTYETTATQHYQKLLQQLIPRHSSSKANQINSTATQLADLTDGEFKRWAILKNDYSDIQGEYIQK